jgi:hypothetical protein
MIRRFDENVIIESIKKYGICTLLACEYEILKKEDWSCRNWLRFDKVEMNESDNMGNFFYIAYI